MTRSNPEHAMAQLEQLPIELLQVILSRLTDVQSLGAVVLTSPCSYHAFLDAQPQIVKEVLQRQIPTELMHDALAAEASKQDVWTREQAIGFLEHYFARERKSFHSSFQWTLSQALPLARLHSLVELFTSSLVSSVLAQKPSAQPLSKTEKFRINCNFYRFEIYCNLFRNKDKIPIYADDDQREEYFAHFAPWENEQLACTHDYLLLLITPAFEEVAMNDPDWVDFFVIMSNGLDEGTLQHHLSFDLAHIRRFLEAKSPQSQRDLLASFKKDSTREFLSFALGEASYLGGVTLAEMESENEEEFIPKPRCADPDTGPEDVWRWAHQAQPSGRSIFSPSQIPLRQWAYVVWDRARLDEWKVFGTPWEGVDAREYEREETSRRLQEAGGMRIRALGMIRDGRLKPSLEYLLDLGSMRS